MEQTTIQRQHQNCKERPDCGKELNAIRDAIYVIGGKWRLPIIVTLRGGHTRFNDIQKTVGISAKVLSTELKSLELNGIVKRKVQHDSNTIEYELTDYSRTLHDVLESLGSWGTQHKEKIRKEMRNGI